MASAPSHSPTPTAEAYARQRQAGFRWLNFSPELERQYRKSSQAVVDHQSNVALFVGMAIWLAFLFLDAVRLDEFWDQARWERERWQILHIRGVVLACFVACVLVLQDSRLRYSRRWMIGGMLYLVSLGGSIINALYGKMDVERESSVMLLLVMAMFLPMGLRVKESICLALTCIASVAVLGTVVPETAESEHHHHLHLAFAMLMAAALGTLSAYQREYGQREQFLLRMELEWLARQDALTGLLNRRAFNEHLSLALASARRENHQVALLMIDVDHFKLYNDAYGHAAGDQALQMLAPVLGQLCGRPLDQAARTGGEEMALVLYDVTPEHQEHLCRKLLDGVDRLALGHGASPTTDRVSISVGFALSTPQDDSQSLYKRADALLYEAKRGGRNRAKTDHGLEVRPTRFSAAGAQAEAAPERQETQRT